MTSMGGDPTVQAAMEGTSPDTPQWGRLTPDQISSMMEQGRGTSLDIGAELGQAGPATPSAAQPPAATFSQQDYAMWAQQQQQQQQMAAAREQDQRIQRLEYERRLLAEQAQRAQAYERWFAEHPEVVEQALGQGTAAQQQQQYEDPMAQEVRMLRREAEAARREGALARHLAEHSIEASLLSKQYGNSVDIEALTAYAQENGIPRLRDALAHAAGQVALQAYTHSVSRQQHSVMAPSQQPQQQAYSYAQPQAYAPAPQQQQYYGPSMTPGPAAEPPPASNVVVMRPGAPVGQRPRYQGPASTQDEAFNRVARDLGAMGFA